MNEWLNKNAGHMLRLTLYANLAEVVALCVVYFNALQPRCKQAQMTVNISSQHALAVV